MGNKGLAAALAGLARGGASHVKDKNEQARKMEMLQQRFALEQALRQAMIDGRLEEAEIRQGGMTDRADSTRQLSLEKALAGLRGEVSGSVPSPVALPERTQDLAEYEALTGLKTKYGNQGQASPVDPLIGEGRRLTNEKRRLEIEKLKNPPPEEDEDPPTPRTLSVTQYQEAVRGEVEGLFDAWRQQAVNAGAEAPANLAELRQRFPRIYESLVKLATDGVREDLGELLPPEVQFQDAMAGEMPSTMDDPDRKLDALADKYNLGFR